MATGIEVICLFHDDYVTRARVLVSNSRFQGATEVYLGEETLVEAAKLLQHFPQHAHDTRELILGDFGPNTALGGVRLEFFCKDMAGHPMVRVTIEADSPHRFRDRAGVVWKPESAVIYADFEPAALDNFIIQLESIGRTHKGSAVLYASTS
jgi:hypothetical protein